MKATLSFDLDEPSDREAHLRCTKSMDIVLALHDIREMLRQMEDVEQNEDKRSILEAVRTRYYELLDQHGVNLEDLIS